MHTDNTNYPGLQNNQVQECVWITPVDQAQSAAALSTAVSALQDADAVGLKLYLCNSSGASKWRLRRYISRKEYGSCGNPSVENFSSNAFNGAQPDRPQYSLFDDVPKMKTGSLLEPHFYDPCQAVYVNAKCDRCITFD